MVIPFAIGKGGDVDRSLGIVLLEAYRSLVIIGVSFDSISCVILTRAGTGSCLSP